VRAVLHELVAHAHARAAGLRELPPPSARPRLGFVDAIAGRQRLAVIAEWKRASPSAGSLATTSLATQVRAYEDGGARAISVVTEDSRFGGSFDDLGAIGAHVALPLLLKDFVVAPRQIEVAARLGASAVLLIARILEGSQLADLAAVCRAHDLDVLCECHDEAEVERALGLEGAAIGVNNRDLDTLVVDTARAARLLPRVPAGRVAVAESGYATPADARALVGLADAVLIGTALLRSGDPRAFVAEVTQ
jgi:indole-3-glycerol phosphate synthase